MKIVKIVKQTYYIIIEVKLTFIITSLNQNTIINNMLKYKIFVFSYKYHIF